MGFDCQYCNRSYSSAEYKYNKHLTTCKVKKLVDLTYKCIEDIETNNFIHNNDPFADSQYSGWPHALRSVLQDYVKLKIDVDREKKRDQ